MIIRQVSVENYRVWSGDLELKKKRKSRKNSKTIFEMSIGG